MYGWIKTVASATAFARSTSKKILKKKKKKRKGKKRKREKRRGKIVLKRDEKFWEILTNNDKARRDPVDGTITSRPLEAT